MEGEIIYEESIDQPFGTPSTSSAAENILEDPIHQTFPTSTANGDNGIREDLIDQPSLVPSNNANNGPDLEDLVNGWFNSITKSIFGNDAVTINGRRHLWECVETSPTLRKFVEGDSESGDSNLIDLLKKLIRCAYLNDLSCEEFRRNLKKLLEGRIFQSTVIRAKLYSRLIAVALKLKPEEISPDDHKPEFVNDYSWKKIVEMLGRGSARLMSLDKVPSTKSHHGNVLRAGTILPYLMRELEEDDDIMTLIFASRSHFNMYPVPYFEGCTLEMVREMSKLWVSVSVLYSYHFKHIFNPIFYKLTQVYEDIGATNLDGEEEEFETTADLDTLRKEIWTNENFIKAKVMLWNELGTRGGKAGARLLWFFIKKMGGRSQMVGHLVKEVFSRPRDLQLKKHFLDINPDYWSELVGTWSRTGTDQEENGEGQFINIGLPSSYTDYNLLCWAARRGYFLLIWIVAQIFKPSSSPDPYLYVNTVLGGTDAWKCALWCATRHGQEGVIRELLAPNWIIESIDFNDYPWGWLPPVHLVALLGDVILLRHFAKVELGAIRKLDYLGRTPLDHAMPFISPPKKIKHHLISRSLRTPLDHTMPSISNPKQISPNFSRPSKKGTRFNKNGQQQVVKQLLEISGVEEYLKELYGMYINQANTVLIGAALIASVAFVGWLQPPLGYTDYFQFSQPSPPAPTGTYDSYVAVEGHLSIQIFVVFNTLSFFLAIATMFLGTEATLFVRDRHERSRYLFDMRKSVKWMVIFFIGSMLFIMVAFISAGLTVLPPIWKLKWSMILSLIVGAGISVIPLIWILNSSMSGNRNFFRTFKQLLLHPLKQLPLHPLKDWNDFTKDSLVYKFSDDDCSKLFKDWDADGDGYITITELLNLKSGYTKWSLPEAQEIMEKADDDGNKRLDYEEFKKMYMIMPVEGSELPSDRT
ncbi:hypothetical protein M758_12G038900 [Ceratodon purpureus]|nr:hypothetical protein M758_12G038900 [Ceratodon purpureus]